MIEMTPASFAAFDFGTVYLNTLVLQIYKNRISLTKLRRRSNKVNKTQSTNELIPDSNKSDLNFLSPGTRPLTQTKYIQFTCRHYSQNPFHFAEDQCPSFLHLRFQPFRLKKC